MSTAGHSPTDGSAAPWEVLQLLLPTPTWRPGGPGRKPLDRRRVLNGIVYVNKPGCQWRMRPTQSGHAPTLYGYLRRWRPAGVWGRVMDTLRPWARQSPGRLPDPSAGGAESQRTKTATQAEDIGCEGHQQVTGRQRHLLVETLGLIVAVVVPAATPDDRRGLVALLQRYGASGTKRLRQLGGDAAEPAQWLCAWGRRLPQPPEIARDVVEHPGKECQVVQHGWKEERTVAW